ncbi:hypothetical protein [Paraclostridium sordellii]|uniref:hypothetical protein n=1 Tax=Paraclostridium sordellii TaxID=1505 RepID=UPI0005DD6097|nr:hypothetical protein [Paeniclostridium sordellii]CEO08405.1 Uncharacterised protein [[Clostridium] sordellii] [Paeniclostridium sordellii]CEP87198.1 Uncharacterised protein [[Clostridium] sordellii] [Paeniclostridium sordellii]CEP95536.1 Uncharacterised protein [[Clostridium] sordellii] [Paeniclostridium sordellii]CEP99124.1 Uncharacterised protein [[Clostridium] sordellii] [Paeniclostridium sordellii]
MKESYYNRLKRFLSKKINKIFINILSPTYLLYNSMKIKGNNEYNKELANNTKLFFLSMSLFTISMISIYDISNLNGESGIFKLSYIILCTLPTYIAFNYFLTSFKKIDLNYENLEKKDQKRYNRFKFIFSKKIFIIINIIFILYCCINIAGINFFENSSVIKVILFGGSIWIFAISRPIHLFSVFILDMLKKLTQGYKRDIDEKIRLILLAIGSVINIILDYSILFYMLNTIGFEFYKIPMFNVNVKNIADMIYFTCGFSGIDASNFITRSLVILKNISIFIIMTGNLAIYLNIDTGKEIVQNKIDAKDVNE